VRARGFPGLPRPRIALRGSGAPPAGLAVTSKAMTRDLFSPFLENGRVDERLLLALGIAAGDCEGRFEHVVDPVEGTAFDFYMETKSGRRYFFDVKLSEAGFDSCADDDRHREKLERHYRPHLREHVDAKWLEPAAFFANYEVLRHLSYLGRYADSGLVFIFPKANEGLMAGEETIKQIVSKSLAPRVAVFHVEYLVGRILDDAAEDESLRKYCLELRERYAARAV